MLFVTAALTLGAGSTFAAVPSSGAVAKADANPCLHARDTYNLLVTAPPESAGVNKQGPYFSSKNLSSALKTLATISVSTDGVARKNVRRLLNVTSDQSVAGMDSVLNLLSAESCTLPQFYFVQALVNTYERPDVKASQKQAIREAVKKSLAKRSTFSNLLSVSSSVLLLDRAIGAHLITPPTSQLAAFNDFKSQLQTDREHLNAQYSKAFEVTSWTRTKRRVLGWIGIHRSPMQDMNAAELRQAMNRELSLTDRYEKQWSSVAQTILRE